jgi:DNA-directed RNA polymerase specialized sigma24 family protein
MARRAYGNEPCDMDDMAVDAPTFTGPKNIETPLEQAALTAFLDRALAHLPPPTRLILLERYVDELAPAEIAARWGLSENATAVRLHRSRQALRQVLTTRLRAEAASYDLLPARVAPGTATSVAVSTSEGRRGAVSSIGKFGV